MIAWLQDEHHWFSTVSLSWLYKIYILLRANVDRLQCRCYEPVHEERAYNMLCSKTIRNFVKNLIIRHIRQHWREVSSVMPLFNMTPYITQQLFRILFYSSLMDRKIDTSQTAAFPTPKSSTVSP
jgi:hypothetical protein